MDISDWNMWYEMAQDFDECRATNEAFVSSGRTLAPLVTRLAGTSFIRTSSTPFSRQPALTTMPAHTPRHAYVPVPVEADTAKPRSRLGSNCLRCGKPRHWSRDCLDHFDVRLLSMDELQEILEDRNTLLDVVAEDSGSPEEKPAGEDFHPDDE
jgi:hypothetical protein